MTGHVVDQAGRGDCLARAGWPLDQGQRRCQHRLAGQDLGRIQGRQSWGREHAWHMCLDQLRLNLMAQQPA